MGTSPSTTDIETRVAEAAAAVRERGARAPRVTLTLGSGLSGLADAIEDAVVVPTAEIPHWPRSTVAGHAGRLVIGRWRGVEIAAIAGRSHRYEGYGLDRSTFGVRVAHALGARTFLFTNAAGGVGDDMAPGDLMVASDHLNFVGKHGLLTAREREEQGMGRPMAHLHDPRLRESLLRAAKSAGVVLKTGVLLAMHGPSYETAAEIRWARAMGADAVCMSTVHEVTVAARLGGRAASLSTITNRATGLGDRPLSHHEVTEAAGAASARLRALLEAFLDGEAGEG
jgi:purine-nucleoside phosphorylase